MASLLIAGSLTTGGQKPKLPASDSIRRADAAFRAGVAARESGNLQVARSKFAEVVQLQPRIAEGHEALGAVLAELGMPLDGAKEFEAAAKIKPDDQMIESNLALTYAQAGAAAKAIPHFQAAENLSRRAGHGPLEPSFFDAYGRALAEVGRTEEAIPQFVAEEALTGPKAEIDDAIGTLYAQQSKWDEARKRFLHALELDEAYVKARVHLAMVLRTQKNLQGALDALAPAMARQSSG